MENIENINVLRLERGLEKICRCRDKKYIVDVENRLVWCQTCHAVIEPFEALRNLGLRYEEINEQVERAIKYRNNLTNYKPHLRQAKRYEEMMKEKDMLPICPRCQKPFMWEDVNSMINKKFIKEVE